MNADVIRYSDAHLERCGDEYIAFELGKRGVSFEQFLAKPEHYLRMDEPHGRLPLLPAQQRVVARLWAAWDREAILERIGLSFRKSGVVVKDGAQFQPLHKHHTGPKHSPHRTRPRLNLVGG